MHAAPVPTPRDERGFSLVELTMVIAIMAVLAAVTLGVRPDFVRTAKADSGVAQALDTLRSAREIAISQRRNVQVRFIGTNIIETARVNVPAGDTTVLRRVQLENRMHFVLVPGVPDTPDRFGRTAAVSFGPSAARMFTSEGTFVDSGGDPLNGTLFLAVPDEPNTARAITVFGATALLRIWRWDGSKWIE
jgi:prepilin-type N-terminal cleavage/methylation domain-containing protein